MKIGISMSTYDTRFGPVVLRAGSLEEKLATAAALGYDGADLFSDITDEDEARRVGRAFRRAGLEVAMMVAIKLSENGVNLTEKDPARRSASVDAYKRQIDIAAAMGAARMPVGFLRGMRPEDMSPEAYDTLLAESLAAIASYAAGCGVEICVEPVNRYEINTLNSAAQAHRFLRKHPVPNVSLLLDAFHMNMEDAGIPQTIALCKGYIGHVHLPDNNRYACGSGCFDYDAILQALRLAGYDGYLSVEAFPVPDQKTCAEQSIATLRRYL